MIRERESFVELWRLAYMNDKRIDWVAEKADCTVEQAYAHAHYYRKTGETLLPLPRRERHAKPGGAKSLLARLIHRLVG